MYTIIELQSTNGTTVVVPPVSFNNLNEAYQKFYMALAAAAVSAVPTHAVVMLNEKGEFIRSEYFEHNTETEE